MNKKYYNLRYIRDLGFAAYTEGPDTTQIDIASLHSFTVEVGCCNIDIHFIYEDEEGHPIFKHIILPLNKVEETQ